MSTTTPNMNLILPTPTVEAGPEWAAELNAALVKVDSHDHSSGFGRKVTPAGMDINANLDVQQHALIGATKVGLVNQPAALSGVSNANSISIVNGNLYVTNSGGVAVQITNGTSVLSTTIVPSSPLMPAGTVLDYAGITVPPGFLSADGSAVSRTTYADLFTAIATAHGVGDGSTTFNLPNFSGRAAIGSGTYTDTGGTNGTVTRSLAQTVGASVHTITTAQMPSHHHNGPTHYHDSTETLNLGGTGQVATDNTLSVQNAGNVVANQPGSYGATLRTRAAGSTMVSNGSDAAHNNMQPSLVINKIIKY